MGGSSVSSPRHFVQPIENGSNTFHRVQFVIPIESTVIKTVQPENYRRFAVCSLPPDTGCFMAFKPLPIWASRTAGSQRRIEFHVVGGMDREQKDCMERQVNSNGRSRPACVGMEAAAAIFWLAGFNITAGHWRFGRTQCLSGCFSCRRNPFSPLSVNNEFNSYSNERIKIACSVYVCIFADTNRMRDGSQIVEPHRPPVHASTWHGQYLCPSTWSSHYPRCHALPDRA
jgi:hypothetical protein